MKKVLSSFVVAAVLATGVRVDALAQRRVVPLFIDYDVNPKTWADLLQRAELTVIVRLRNREFTKDSDKRSLPKTRYEAEVVDVLRNTGRQRVGDVIDIIRFGGTFQTPQGPATQEEAHFPAWLPGTTLLLFLNWFEPDHSFAPMGPNSAFELDPQTAKVRTFGKSALALKQNGRRFDEALAELKAKIRDSSR